MKTQSTTTLERIQRHRTSIDGKLTKFLLYSISRLLPKSGGVQRKYTEYTAGFTFTIAQRGQLLTLQQLPDPQACISQLSTQIPTLSVYELTPAVNSNP